MLFTAQEQGSEQDRYILVFMKLTVLVENMVIDEVNEGAVNVML